MTTLVRTAGPQSPLLHGAALPLVTYATSGTQVNALSI